jgi:hypothetical protein
MSQREGEVARGRGARISDFLTRLAESKTFARSYEGDPIKVMQRFGLSRAQRVLIKSGDLRKIRKAIEEETGGVAIYFYIKKPSPPPPTKKYIKKST